MKRLAFLLALLAAPLSAQTATVTIQVPAVIVRDTIRLPARVDTVHVVDTVRIVDTVFVGQPPDTTPPIPPVDGIFQGWFSDHANQQADQGHIYDGSGGPATVRATDSGKWSSVSRVIHTEVATAPTSAPFAKWIEFEITPPTSNGGQTEILVSSLPPMGVNMVRTWRWYETYDQPGNVGAENNHHGIGAKIPGGGELWTQDASYDVSDEARWVDFFAVPGEGGAPNRKWGVWQNCNVQTGSNNCATQFRYTKGALYMKVAQVVMVSSSTFRLKLWTYTVDPVTHAVALLHSPADYRNENGSATLASNPVLTGSMNLAASFTIGSNGIGGTFPMPLPFMHIGGVAIVDGLPEGAPLGAYGSVLGEVPR